MKQYKAITYPKGGINPRMNINLNILWLYMQSNNIDLYTKTNIVFDIENKIAKANIINIFHPKINSRYEYFQ